MYMLTNSILSDSKQNNEVDIIDMNIVGLPEKNDTNHKYKKIKKFS